MFRGYYHSFWHDDPSDPLMSLGADGVDQLVGFVVHVEFLCIMFPFFSRFPVLAEEAALVGFVLSERVQEPNIS